MNYAHWIIMLVLSSSTLGLLLYFVVWALLNSKNWHGIGAALHVEQLSVEVSAVKGNFEAFKRDTATWLRDIQECNRQILRQLDAIQKNGAKEHPLEERIREMKEEMDEALQTLHGLPCYMDKELHAGLLDEMKKNKEPKP